MSQVPVRVENYTQWEPGVQKRFTISFENLPFPEDTKLEILRDIAAWLKTRPLAPSLLESGDGWHKKLGRVVMEGEDDHGTHLFSQAGLRKWKGVDLDQWKPPQAKTQPPKKGSADPATSLFGPEE